jgi:hypothetical protein
MSLKEAKGRRTGFCLSFLYSNQISSLRGGGNVGIGFIDFQGLWEGRKTVLSFSGLSINRHFLGRLAVFCLTV